MAQVLAPIVQSTGSITMLHSSSDAFQTQPAQPHHQQSRSSQMPRSQPYNGQQSGQAGYRGTSTPIAPYAFSSTPQLRQENRSTSAPSPQSLQQIAQPATPARLGHPTHPSSSSDSTVSTSGSSSRSMTGPPYASKDDSDVRKSGVDTFPSTITLSTSVPDLSLSLNDAPVKPSPGRYRRAANRSDSSNSAVTSSSTPTPTQQSPSVSVTSTAGASKLNNLPPLATDVHAPARPGHNRASSVDDMHIPRAGSMDQAKRYRRRSLSGLDANAMATSTTSTTGTTGTTGTTTAMPAATTAPTASPAKQPHRTGVQASNTQSKGASEPKKRIAPSPLSHPISPSEPPSPAKAVEAAAPSAAVQQLTALNGKEGGKGMKSRLRRAFSFGSAAELRRASAENTLSAERAKLRKDKYQTELDAEQAAIVAKQEAAGIGAGIYNGQGGFSGSTDNLSISSTASSASIMLRKMGSGMKKGTRSIKGLFRPKSVIGVPAADGPITQPSVGQVSMVTVEAERQKVNVNADPHEQVGGGTGYPRLERNSVDAGRTTTDATGTPSPANESMSRKSIVGGDRERAEVLSSIKKGILKRTGTNSDSGSPVPRPAELARPETPRSSAPSTPNDNAPHAHDDYFARPPRLLNASTRSLPTTPQGGLRNISFSPRLTFYEAWSAGDYDRRGDIATCNRLTPMLAQQIKEELNSFKMEMEVHEQSKPHTHFF
ncbi:hypothetical protein BS50DRAFT_596115 [Corynespora cassiicola Philippines]|uniref:Protein BNI4 n=1 Tax=Corynespora cassiicola Philippines TaxID=1448308 RepID=A0A2T2PBD2_CORCC|nr:hypothetical protein BS50DRAFT_596115 [Corynespora cassiicola Philippines]